MLYNNYRQVDDDERHFACKINKSQKTRLRCEVSEQVNHGKIKVGKVLKCLEGV